MSLVGYSWRDPSLPQSQDFSGSTSQAAIKPTPPTTPMENKESSDAFVDEAFASSDKDAVNSNCVWVGNVSPEITEASFRKQFEQFGEIELIRMFARSKCAFVTFMKAESAKASLKLEGKLLGSMYLTLNLGKASPHLWVGNIGQQVTELELRTAFEAYGTVESVRVLRGNKCAFVNFSSEVEAMKALEAMNGRTLGNQKIVINFQWENSFKRPGRLRGPVGPGVSGASGYNLNGVGGKGTRYPPGIARSFDIPSRQLFVGSIVPSVTDGTLWHLFSKFGEVEQIKGYANRGYAFVVFRSLQVAIWVREQMKLYPPTIGGRALVVNFGRQPTSNNGLDDYPYPIPGQPLHVPAPVISSPSLTSHAPMTAPLPPHIPGTSPLPLTPQYPYPSSHTMISHPTLPGYGIPTESYIGTDTLTVPSELSLGLRSASPALSTSSLLSHGYTGQTSDQPMSFPPTITVDDYSYDSSGVTPLTLHGVFREPPSPTAPLTGPTATAVPLQFIPASAHNFSYSHTLSTPALRGYVPESYAYGGVPSPSHISHTLGLGSGGIAPALTSITTLDESIRDNRHSELSSNVEGTSIPGGLTTRVDPPPPGPRPGVAITRSGSGSVVHGLSLGTSSNGSVLSPLGSGLPTESNLLESLASLTIGAPTISTSITQNSSSSDVSTSSLYQDSPVSLTQSSLI